MRNFGELKSDVAKLAQRTGDTDYETAIGIWINKAHTFLANIYDYYSELEGIHNFNTVDGTEDYFMPNDFDKPLRVYDITNDNRLNVDTEVEYFDSNIANIIDANTAVPQTARMYGVSGIKATIGASGTTTQVKSSSANDTGSIVVRIEGYIDSDKTILDYENVTVSTGTPTTFVAGTKTFYEITHVSKSGDTEGYITLADSTGATLAILAATDRVLRHRVMKLGQIPNGAYSMRVLYKRKVRVMVNDNDYPFIEADDYLTSEAFGFALSEEKSTIQRAQVVWAKATESLNAILGNLNRDLGPEHQRKMTSNLTRAHRV